MQADPISDDVQRGRAGQVMRAGRVLLWMLLAVLALEFLRAAYLKYAPLDSPAYAMFMTRRGWLWCHLGGGAVGIVLGTLQWVTQRWRAAPQVHRWLGRAYVGGMLVAVVGAAGLIVTSPAPPAIRIAFAATSLAWLVTAAMGWQAIRHGQLRAHRRWMLRAYLVTLAPVAFRLALPATIQAGMAPSPGMIAALLWSSWMLPLTACVLIQRRSA